MAQLWGEGCSGASCSKDQRKPACSYSSSPELEGGVVRCEAIGGLTDGGPGAVDAGSCSDEAGPCRLKRPPMERADPLLPALLAALAVPAMGVGWTVCRVCPLTGNLDCPVNFIEFVDDSEEMLLSYLKTYREGKLLLQSNTP